MGIARSTEGTSGELFESTNWIDPGMPGPPVHVHPNAAGRSEAFFRDMHRLIHEGKLKRLPPKEPRSAPNAIFKALALAGRALRFKL